MSAAKLDPAATAKHLEAREIQILSKIALHREEVDKLQSELLTVRGQRSGLKIGLSDNASAAGSEAGQ